MSIWEDLSDKDKLKWLRARVTKLENDLSQAAQLLGEMGQTVKELEKKLTEKK